jgi:hypothetical protein
MKTKLPQRTDKLPQSTRKKGNYFQWRNVNKRKIIGILLLSYMIWIYVVYFVLLLFMHSTRVRGKFFKIYSVFTLKSVKLKLSFTLSVTYNGGRTDERKDGITYALYIAAQDELLINQYGSNIEI